MILYFLLIGLCQGFQIKSGYRHSSDSFHFVVETTSLDASFRILYCGKLQVDCSTSTTIYETADILDSDIKITSITSNIYNFEYIPNVNYFHVMGVFRPYLCTSPSCELSEETFLCGHGTVWDGLRCTECGDGRYQVLNECLNCPPGKVSQCTSNKCIDCGSGHYQFMNECLSCSHGYISSPGATVCEKCPGGKIASSMDASQCIPAVSPPSPSPSPSPWWWKLPPPSPSWLQPPSLPSHGHHHSGHHHHGHGHRGHHHRGHVHTSV